MTMTTTPRAEPALSLFRIYWQDGRYSGIAIVSADNAEDAKQQVQARKPRADVHYPETFGLARGILTLG